MSLLDSGWLDVDVTFTGRLDWTGLDGAGLMAGRVIVIACEPGRGGGKRGVGLYCSQQIDGGGRLRNRMREDGCEGQLIERGEGRGKSERGKLDADDLM